MQDIALHLLDLIDNSLRAGATRIGVRVVEDGGADRLCVELEDNGGGMDEDTLARARDPFFSTKPGKPVGLGLALFAQAARECGGALEVSSRPGRGTLLRATFRPSHPDCKPLGDLEGTIRLLEEAHPQVTFDYEYRTARGGAK